MDENFPVSHNAFDDSEADKKVNDIVRLLLNEQKHTLSEEDQKILRDREILRNEFHTLQNVNPFTTSDTTFPAVWNFSDKNSTTRKSDQLFVDNHEISQSSASIEDIDSNNVDSNDINIDNSIANFIQNESIKAEVLSLNEQIESHSSEIRTLTNKAKELMAKKWSLKRELALINKKISEFSVDEARIERIKRKKGVDCADTGHQKNTYFCRFGVPYFKTKDRFPADKNADLKEIIRTNQPMVLRLPGRRRFLPHDASFLNRNVLKQLKEKRINQLNNCLRRATIKKRMQPDDELLDEEIRCIKKTIKDTEAVSNIADTKDWNIPVDFMEMPASKRFSVEEFERIWNLSGSPSLCKEEFSENELVELKSLAEKYNAQNWDRIAEEMSTRRSGFMCFTKYASMFKKGKNLPWTKEENELLLNLCTSVDFISKSDSRYKWWKNIRSHFPHRTYSQIHSHWTYVLEPKLKKGRFTLDEHRLMEAMLKEGKTCREIAQIVQNRTCNQIRAHFEHSSRTEMIKGNWTPEEEEKLLKLVEEHGTQNWVKISEKLGSRNRSQCRLKYMLFMRNNGKFPSKTKIIWSDEENKLFGELLQKHGGDLAKVSEEMPGKTMYQVRHKFYRSKFQHQFQDVLSNLSLPNMKQKCPWNEEEIELFKKLLEVYGPQYTKIRRFIPSKTALQLRYKYYSMKNEWNVSIPVKPSYKSSNYHRVINNTNVPCSNSSSQDMVEYTSDVDLPINFSLQQPNSNMDAADERYLSSIKHHLLPDDLFENFTVINGPQMLENSHEFSASPCQEEFIVPFPLHNEPEKNRSDCEYVTLVPVEMPAILPAKSAPSSVCAAECSDDSTKAENVTEATEKAEVLEAILKFDEEKSSENLSSTDDRLEVVEISSEHATEYSEAVIVDTSNSVLFSENILKCETSIENVEIPETIENPSAPELVQTVYANEHPSESFSSSSLNVSTSFYDDRHSSSPEFSIENIELMDKIEEPEVSESSHQNRVLENYPKVRKRRKKCSGKRVEIGLPAVSQPNPIKKRKKRSPPRPMELDSIEYEIVKVFVNENSPINLFESDNNVHHVAKKGDKPSLQIPEIDGAETTEQPCGRTTLEVKRKEQSCSSMPLPDEKSNEIKTNSAISNSPRLLSGSSKDASESGSFSDKVLKVTSRGRKTSSKLSAIENTNSSEKIDKTVLGKLAKPSRPVRSKRLSSRSSKDVDVDSRTEEKLPTKRIRKPKKIMDL